MAEAPTESIVVRCRCCNYDLTGLPRDGLCPECGALIARSFGWRDRARPPAVSSVVLAVVTLLATPWLFVWPLVLWGWGAVLAYTALLAVSSGVRSRRTRNIAILGLLLNVLLFCAAFGKLVLTGWLL